jgi:purine-binding chemotaxis protein CheW
VARLQLCTFTLGESMFSFAVDGVQEVLPPRPITRVPLAEQWVAGVVALRGLVLPVLDLGTMLGLEPARGSGARAGDARAMHVVLRSTTGRVSVLVDAVGDVIDEDGERMLAPPASVDGPGAVFVRGAFPLDDALLVVLDHELVATPLAA